MTKQTPDNACTQPAAATGFLTTDPIAYLWFLVSGVSVGDDYSVAFYTPAGTNYAGGAADFGPQSTPGNYCYDVGMYIAGYAPATLPGTWNAYIYNNGTQIDRVSFAIATPATCSYSLLSSSASVAAAGGSGSFSVTAGSGCAWTAASVVSWITTTSSGSGGGTVTYTVAANTSTSSRIGAITVGGQTFTVTQAAASTSITIANPGFETLPSNPAWITCAGAGCRDTLDGNIPGWTASSGGQMGLFQPSSTYFTLPLPAAEGQTIAQVNSGALAQTLSATLQASTLYTLQVDVGRRLDNLYPSTPPAAQLFAGATLIASATGAQPSLGGWTTWTGAYQSSASDPLAGQALKIVLGTTASQGDFDNVRLTAGGTLTGTLFTYNGFASTAGLTLVGNAATTSTSDGTVLRLTPASSDESGAAYSTTAVTLGNNATFSTQFQFRFTNPGGWDPADGIVFVLGTSTQGLGGNGMGMGYQGVGGNSVGIEFDTYNNTGAGLGNDDGNSSNHVAIDTNGNLTNTDLTNVYGNGSCGFTNGSPAQNLNTAAGCMSNGDLWTVNISYDGSKLTVILTDPAKGSSFTAINAYAINLASLLGQSIAFVGFTAGTGAGWENHDIVNWTFANTAQSSVCTYSLSPSSASVAATQSTGTVTVTAGTGCAWTAVSGASWITTTSSGTGNGTVSYTVAANTSASSRTGTITVGGQTFTVTQAAAVVCSYSIAPTSGTMAAQGGSSSISVAGTASSSCTWTAFVSSSASSWLHLGPVTSGSGNGSVSYTADPNTSTVSRTGTITVAGLTFTLTQAGGASATAPSINQGGIVNAISNRGGGIAQGSMFTIYGSNLGPTASWTASQFPLPDNEGGVTVTVTQGSTTLKAYLLYVQAAQINAIMPSSTPLGNVQVVVNYNGVLSTAATVTIVKTAFGINSSAYGPGPGIIKNYNSQTDQPFNTASTPAKPGQVEIAVGTGLGAITTADNIAPTAGNLPVAVQVLVGGIPASVSYSGREPCCAGGDQINFTVPANAPLGCSVPVQISAGGTWSNTVRMAISSNGSHCQDAFNPYSGLSTTGGKSGTIGLIRVNFSGSVDPTQPPTTASLDLGLGGFALTNPGTDFTYSPVTNLPPPGTCASSNKLLDLGAVMGDGGSNLDPTIAAGLDAGPQLTVTGGAGGATGTIPQTSTSDSPNSPYMGLLGGILNISGATVPPPFLDGGPFTVSGPGGKDVGPFTTTIALAPAIHWTNPPSTINRSSPLTLTWTGGNSTQLVLILGGSTDQTSQASGGFVCLAQATAGTFTVPVNALADLIPTGVATSSSSPVGMLGLMPLQPANMQFTKLPTGLNVGVAFDATMTVQTVQVQ